MAQILEPHEIKKEPILEFTDNEDTTKSAVTHSDILRSDSLDSKRSLDNSLRGDDTFTLSASSSQQDYALFNASNKTLQMPSTTCDKDNVRTKQHPKEASRQLENPKALKSENGLGMTFPLLLSSSQSATCFDNNVQTSSTTSEKDNVRTQHFPQIVSSQPGLSQDNNINKQTVKSENGFGMTLPCVEPLPLGGMKEELNTEIKMLEGNEPVTSSNSEQSVGVGIDSVCQPTNYVVAQDHQSVQNMTSCNSEIRKCRIVLKREVYDVRRPYLREIIGFGEMLPGSNSSSGHEMESSSSTVQSVSLSDNQEHNSSLDNADTSIPLHPERAPQTKGIKKRPTHKKQNKIRYHFRRQGYLGKKRRMTPQEAICTKLLENVDFRKNSKVRKRKPRKQPKPKNTSSEKSEPVVHKRKILKFSIASYMASLLPTVKKLENQVLIEDYLKEEREKKTPYKKKRRPKWSRVMNFFAKIPKRTDLPPVDEVDANLKVEFFPDSDSPEADSNKEGNKEKWITDASDKSQECNKRSSEESTPLNAMNSDEDMDDLPVSFDFGNQETGTALGENMNSSEISEEWNSSKAPSPYKKQTVAKSSMRLRERNFVNPAVAKGKCSDGGKPTDAAVKSQECNERSSEESTQFSEMDAVPLTEIKNTKEGEKQITDTADKSPECNKRSSEESTLFPEMDTKLLNAMNSDYSDEDMDDLPVSFDFGNQETGTAITDAQDKSPECNKRSVDESTLFPEMDAEPLNVMNFDKSNDHMDDLPVSFGFCKSETRTCQTVQDKIVKSCEVSKQRNSSKMRRPSKKLTDPKFALRLKKKRLVNPDIANRLRVNMKWSLAGSADNVHSQSSVSDFASRSVNEATYKSNYEVAVQSEKTDESELTENVSMAEIRDRDSDNSVEFLREESRSGSSSSNKNKDKRSEPVMKLLNKLCMNRINKSVSLACGVPSKSATCLTPSKTRPMKQYVTYKYI